MMPLVLKVSAWKIAIIKMAFVSSVFVLPPNPVLFVHSDRKKQRGMQRDRQK